MILDSNVIIYSVQPGYEILYNFLERNKGNLQASLITQLEVLGFHRIEPDDKTDFETFFALIPILPIDEEVIAEAIRLRQQRKRSLGDSIIAATALLYNLPVLAGAEQQRKRLDGH